MITALDVLVIMLIVLTVAVGLGPAGWLTGLAFAVIGWAVLTDGMRRFEEPSFSPRGRLILARAVLVGGVAALAVETTDPRPDPVTALIVLAAAAIAVGALTARRTAPDSTTVPDSTTFSEPLGSSKPLGSSQSTTLSKPPGASEAAGSSESTATSEPSAASEPSTASELQPRDGGVAGALHLTAASEPPATTELAGTAKSPEASAPPAASKLAVSSEPAAFSESTGASEPSDVSPSPKSPRSSAFDARFALEVEAFFVMALSAFVATRLGVWVMAIGGLRYVFVVAGSVFPWLRVPLPDRAVRRVVAAVQNQSASH